MLKILLPSQVIDSNLNTDALRLRGVSTFCVQINVSVFTSFSTTFKLQASNDKTNWSDIEETFHRIEEVKTFMLNIPEAGYEYMRVVFASASGNITADVVVSGRDIH